MNRRQTQSLIWMVIGFILLMYAPGPVLKLLDVIFLIMLGIGVARGIGGAKRLQPPSTDLEQAYRLLGCHPTDPIQQITTRYRDLVFISHPDRLPPNSPESRIQEAHRLTEDYNRAYELVMNQRQKKVN